MSQPNPGRPYYITTPIYYVNDRPHIGHVYTTTIADMVARDRRLRGHQAFLLTGTDEHAAKVVDAAKERGLEPLQWADQNAASFESTFARLGIRNQDFIRTTQERHKERVRHYVRALLDKGDVYEGTYEGWYDAGQEEYVPDNKAEQWEFLSPVNGKPLVRKKERNWFFRLSAFQDELLAHYEKHPDFLLPIARRNELIGRIKEGLQDVPMSRTGSGGWGIGVPGDEEQTIYVWIDALFNYLSTVDTEERRSLWPADVHLIAKDILWFHACIWPALLMALRKCPGHEWVALPRSIRAHSFWISEGRKMSKSLGNFITLEKIDDYCQRFGLDALRYYLASRGPLGTSDRDFSEGLFIEVYNKELANSVGNCANRVTVMIGKYCEGKLPAAADPVDGTKELRELCERAAGRHAEAMAALDVDQACAAALEVFTGIDAYIDATAPFKLAKDPARTDELATVLYSCAEALRFGSLLLWPIMPERMQEVWRRLGLGYAPALEDEGTGKLDEWLRWGESVAGTPIERGAPLFARYDASAG